MTRNVHAHKVLNQLDVNPMDEAGLRDWIAQEFGDDVVFHTCKLQDLSVDALFTFLQEHHKVLVNDGIWFLNKEKICQH